MGDQRNLGQLTLRANKIWGNGTINNFSQHNTYIEGIDTVYEFNQYGLLRAGATGTGLKDRGANTIIRYNSIQGGGHLIDLVETQNYASVLVTLPSYHQAYVYGNVLVNDTSAVNGAATTPIHYGGDVFPTPYLRKGVLYYYDNTFVNRGDTWRFNLFQLTSGGESVDARNNIVWVTYQTIRPEIDLLTPQGVGYFGANWFSAGWAPANTYYPITGHLAGAVNIITGGSGALNDPGFVNAAAGDYRLQATGPAVDRGVALVATVPPDIFEFDATVAGFGRARTTTGAASDLGAYETDTAPPVISSLAVNGISGSAATVQWTTDKPSDASVEYGTTSAYGGTGALEPSGVAALSTTHDVPIDGLLPGTVYHYRVVSTDASGNAATSADRVFVTGDTIAAPGRELQFGDANMDGRIDADDYALIDRGYLRKLSGWTSGDFNGDNQVNAADYVYIDAALAAEQGGVISAALVSQREAQFGQAYVDALTAAIAGTSSTSSQSESTTTTTTITTDQQGSGSTTSTTSTTTTTPGGGNGTSAVRPPLPRRGGSSRRHLPLRVSSRVVAGSNASALSPSPSNSVTDRVLKGRLRSSL
jgi:hypothetical protein